MELAIGECDRQNPQIINRIDQRIDRVGTCLDIASGTIGHFSLPTDVSPHVP